MHFFCLGVVFGLIFEIFQCIKIMFNNLVITNAVEFVFFVFIAMLFVKHILVNLSGEFYYYIVPACVVGFALERISIGFFFTKLYKLVYNALIKVKNKFAKSKLGKKVLK